MTPAGLACALISHPAPAHCSRLSMELRIQGDLKTVREKPSDRWQASLGTHSSSRLGVPADARFSGPAC